jgi:hypothetical protein
MVSLNSLQLDMNCGSEEEQGSGRRVHQRRNELTRIRKTPQERNEKNKSRQEHVRERRRRALAGFIILKNSFKKNSNNKKKDGSKFFKFLKREINF